MLLAMYICLVHTFRPRWVTMRLLKKHRDLLELKAAFRCVLPAIPLPTDVRASGRKTTSIGFDVHLGRSAETKSSES